MTPQRGDRVRYVARGEAIYLTPNTSGWHYINISEGGAFPAEYSRLPPDTEFEVIHPLKVGDKITMGIGPQPPIGAVVVYPDGDVAQRSFIGWQFLGGFVIEWERIKQRVATVVWLPEVQS